MRKATYTASISLVATRAPLATQWSFSADTEQARVSAWRLFATAVVDDLPELNSQLAGGVGVAPRIRSRSRAALEFSDKISSRMACSA